MYAYAVFLQDNDGSLSVLGDCPPAAFVSIDEGMDYLCESSMTPI